MLLHGSLDPLLFSDGGSLSLTLWLGRSDPSLDSDRLSLGRSELSSPLVDPDSELLAEFDSDADSELESLDCESLRLLADWLPESDRE